LIRRSDVVEAIESMATTDLAWNARLTGDDPSRLGWAVDPDEMVTVGPGAGITSLDRPFELRAEPPIRVSVDRVPDGGVLHLAVNHAFSDGRGALLLLRNLVATLGGHESQPLSAVTDEDLSKLPPGGVLARAGVVAATSRHAIRRVDGLGLDDRDPTVMAVEVLDIAELEGWRSTHPELSVNDICVTAVHRGLRDRTERPGSIAVGVPIDLRRRVGRAASVGNAVLNAVTVSRADHDPGREAADHAAAIRAQSTVEWLGAQLAVFTRFSKPGERPPREPRFSPEWPVTAVCSNLGRVDDDHVWSGVGRLDFAPPAHRIPAVGIVSLSSTITLTVCLRGPDELARSLATGIVSHLRHPDHS
jgi:NRPS condensation-like uncharacterized protein